MNSFAPLSDVKPVLAILSRISLFGGATEVQQKEILRRLEWAVFKKGEYVFQKGDEPSHIYIVKSGGIELEIPDKDTVIEKKALGVGECFGHAALMSMHRHTLAAVAIEESEIMVLSRRAFLQLQHEDIALFALLMMNIAREIARRLMLTDDLLLHYIHTHREVKERV